MPTFPVRTGDSNRQCPNISLGFARAPFASNHLAMLLCPLVTAYDSGVRLSLSSLSKLFSSHTAFTADLSPKYAARCRLVEPKVNGLYSWASSAWAEASTWGNL